MKKFYIFFTLFSSFFIYSQSSMETNFLQSYLSFEQLFLKIGGDYGTTFFPFLNSGYGGRDLAFSGAFTGIADDITTIESNPAGTASLKYTELFFSHNKLMGDVNYNTLAYTMRFGDLGFGLGTRILYIPFTHYDKFGDDVGNGVISYSVITLNCSYNFLRSYEFFGLSVGANIKLYIYGVPEAVAMNQSKVNVAFDIGMLTRFNFLKAYSKAEKNFSIGLSVKNLGPFTDNEPPPTYINIGIGYKPVEQVLMSADFSYLINYSADTYKNWSVKSGVEWKFTSIASILVGFIIKSSPSFSLGFNLNFEDFTVTASYNPDFVDVAKFSVSASLKLGDLGRSKKDEMIKKMYAMALRVINDGNYKDARDILNAILQKDRGFTPAKKSLKNVMKQIDLQKNLNDALNKQQNLTF